jgi:hypothetical protein
MGIPAYVKLAVFVSEAYIIALAARDVFAPGQVIPSLPGDAAFVAGLWPDVMKPSLEGQRMLCACQMLGACALALALAKLATVFSHPHGTYLRRNLMLTFGASDLLIFALLYKHTQFLADGYGVSVLAHKSALVIEGSALLLDALTRTRPSKA